MRKNDYYDKANLSKFDKTNLLKIIDKEIQKRNNLYLKFEKQKLLVSRLLEEYRKQYLD